MATTYILAGGNDRAYDDYGVKLAEVVGDWNKNPKILSCDFARDPKDWSDRSKSWGAWFKAYFGTGIEYKMATIEHFIDEVKWADVVYLHGGETQRLIAALSHYDDLESYFKNKIIIGSSAGAGYLSKIYYSPIKDIIEKGGGILNVDAITHYGADSDGDVPLNKDGWAKVVAKTKAAAGENEEIVLIPEGTFVLIVK
jgi:hypothetical protein